MKAINLPEKELISLYVEDLLTTYEIAEHFNCSQGTVWKYLVKYNVPRSVHGRKIVIIDNKELGGLYLDQKLSSRKISKIYNCSYTTIDKKIVKLGIPMRNRAQSHIIYPRKDFEGDDSEKAYVIGFAMGDLRVRKQYLNSETVKVDCGSNKQEQIDLIESLFKDYGRVWIKDQPNREDYIQIECFLNLSFDFLLKKRILADRWIMLNDNIFISFLAGFTDAEGYITISNQGTALYGIGNYNHRLLRQIKNRLEKLDIRCSKLTEGKTKGKKFGTGAIHNENYWQFTVHQKTALMRLFGLIGPLLRHRKRIYDMNRAIKNIDERNKKYGYINM